MNHKNCFLPFAHVAAQFALAIGLAAPAYAEWREKVLYSFQGGTNDGAFPAGGVVFDKQGNLYGVLQDFGPGSCAPIGNQCGAVFQLSPPAQKGGSWTETLIYEFQGKGANDGESPNGGLVIDSQGNLYGVTAYGGTGNCVLLGVPAGCGTVYEISPPKEKGGAWKETILYSFPTSKQGYLPNGDLVFDGGGNLYGATAFGGTKGTTCDSFYGGQCGVVFELSPPKQKGGKWTETVLHDFAGGIAGKQFGDGANPNGGLVLDKMGTVYGTSFYGGDEAGACDGGSGGVGCGAVFELKPPTEKGGAWTEKVIYRFNVQDGATPAAGVIFGGNGHLYGAASAGGISGNGAVFELTPPKGGRGSWEESVLYRFSDGNDGTNPQGALAFDASGSLYGAALGGGTHRGVVFRLKPPKRGNSWPFSVLYNLNGAPDGDHPTARLIFDSKRNLYSTTEWGGTGQACQGGCGTVFEVSP